MSQGSGAEARVASRDGVPGDGSIIAGKYLIEREIGAGGMGVVVAARHLQLNQLVAVKFLRVMPDSRAELAKRFLREARAAASLRSEHVARVMDVGTLDSGVQFMVMEYLEGQTLSRMIRKRAPMPVDETIDLILQACDAIGEAHSRAIVHRDIKPGNLFVTQRNDGAPLLKVLDFGISKAPELADEQELTATNLILGSPHYVSPEQLRGVKYVDHRTDIWALGVVLYYMLAGRRPFEAEAVSAVCYAIAADTPAPLASIRPDIPFELNEVVMRCLEKDRQKRVQTIGELARALGGFASASSRVSLQHIAQQLPPSEPADTVKVLAPMPQTSGAPPKLHIPVSLRSNAPTIVTSVDRGDKRAPLPVFQIGAILAILGVLLVVVLMPSRHHQERSGVQAVSEVEPAPSPPASASPSVPPPNTAMSSRGGITVDEEGHTILMGSAQPIKSSKPPPNSPKAALGYRWVKTRDVVALYDGPGSGRNAGMLARGQLVAVMEERGMWLRVMHNTESSFVSGWTTKDKVDENPE